MSKDEHETAVGVGSIAGGVALALLATANPLAAWAVFAALTAAAVAIDNRKE